MSYHDRLDMFGDKYSKLSYDPNKGADPKSAGTAMKYREGIKEGMKSKGVKTRGTETAMNGQNAVKNDGSFKEGTFTAADFKDVFGLKSKSESKAYSKGSTTGTKQVEGLGTYMSEKDFNRLRNSDQVKDAYSSVYGKDEASQKFEGNPEGLSINALDAMFDKLSAGAPAEETKGPPKPTQLSQRAAEAVAGQETYRDFMRSGAETDLIFGGAEGRESANQQFSDMYKLNLQKRLEPGGAFGAFAGAGKDTRPETTGYEGEAKAQNLNRLKDNIIGQGAGFQSV